METLDKHAPKKLKILRRNHKTHIKKRRNYVVKLNNQSMQKHFDSLHPFLDSKPFSKSCKPHFSNNHCFGNKKFALNENGDILLPNIKISKAFNSYFELLTDSLELFDWTPQLNILKAKCKMLLKIFQSS